MSGPSKTVLVNLTVASVQLNPRIGRLEETISRVKSLLDKFKLELSRDKRKKVTPDLVVLPEFALTGYNFHSKSSILPYAFPTTESPTFKLAQFVSRDLNCYTVIGYPEHDLKTDTFYNSAMVVSPRGDLVFNYRKHFLYDTDEEWSCEENPRGFQTFDLTFPKCGRLVRQEDNNSGTSGATPEPIDVTLRASIGICMDLNPYKFTAPFNDYEFATYCLDNDVELMICPMAWLHSSSVTARDRENEPDDSVVTSTPSSSSLNTIDAKLKNISDSLKMEGVPEYGSQGLFQIDIDNSRVTARISSEEVDTMTMANSSNGVSTLGYRHLDEPDMSNVNYWILRFFPFVHFSERARWYANYNIDKLLGGRKSYLGVSRDKPWHFAGRQAVLVVANRCGVEDGDTVFAGSSGVYLFNGRSAGEQLSDSMSVDSTNPSVDLLGNLGKGHEGIIMRDVQFNVYR